MRKAFLLLILALLIPAISNAQSVDILWQGETYVPPFYKGRALWSTESRVTFVAMPQGFVNPANLNYRWTKNGTVLGNINGVGKNTISFVDPIISRPQTIRVEIVSGNNVVASSTITVAASTQTLAVYENNSLYGFMLHREIGEGFSLNGREIALAAFPFFFDASGRAGEPMSYEWRTNTGDVNVGSSVTYRTQDSASGAANIHLRASSGSAITQSAERNFSIQFGNN